MRKKVVVARQCASGVPQGASQPSGQPGWLRLELGLHFSGRLGLATLCATLAQGCAPPTLAPLRPMWTADCPPQFTCSSVSFGRADEVDLLLVIDDSASMNEEQTKLVAAMPSLIARLTSDDVDRDGVPDATPIRSVHVGVVSSDLGAGPLTNVPSCASGLGDDGILRRQAEGGCPTTYPSGIFEFARDRGDGPSHLASAVACIGALGTSGCGFEQQLEAALKAVTPSSAASWTREGYVPPRFLSERGELGGVAGQGDRTNTGFLRAGSVLAVLLVTDEEDCSTTDYSLFDVDAERFSGVPLNLRCNTFGDGASSILYPTDRYVDGLLGLRARPELLVVGAITGIPPHTEADAARGDFDAVLADPNMVPRPNAMSTNLEPSCSTAAGVAYPPIRIVQTAAGLASGGAFVTLSSICASSFEPALERLGAQIVEALRPGDCLARDAPFLDDGLIDCELLELLPAGESCAELVARAPLDRVTESGVEREVCQIDQLLPDVGQSGTAPGWYYDEFSFEAYACGSRPRVAFAEGTPIPSQSSFRLVCWR